MEPRTGAGRLTIAVQGEAFRGIVLTVEREAISAYKAELRERVGPEPRADSDYEGGVWAEWKRISALLDSPDQPEDADHG